MSQVNILLGAGGHASVLAECILAEGGKVEAVVGRIVERRDVFMGIPLIECDSEVFMLDNSRVRLINGLGFLPKTSHRKDVFEKFNAQGFVFRSVISRSSIVSKFSKIEEGAQVFPGAILNSGSSIGKNCIVNSGAIVEHDSAVGSHSHIAPGAVVCGGVEVGNNVFIGAGATVLQSLVIGDNAVIAAGTTVTKNVNDNETVHR